MSSSTCVGRMDEEMQPQAYVRSAQQILISLWRCFPLLQKSVELLLFSNSYWIQFQYLIERTSLDRIKNVVFKWEVCYDNYHKICPHLNKAYSQSTWEEDECIFRWSSWSSQYCITIVMTYNLLSSCYVQEMGALGRSVHKVMLQCDLWLSLGEAQAGAAVDEGGSS